MGSAEALVQEEEDPFIFFRPFVVATDDDRDRLDSGEAVARVVPGSRNAIVVFSATEIDTTGDRLIAWMRDIPALKKSAYVQEIRRFSSPPRLADLDTLTLDVGDVEDLDRCRPQRCGLKLAASELAELQRVPQVRGQDRTPALQEAFRELVLRRVQTYLAGGHGALPDHDDRRPPVSPQATFLSLLDQFGFLRQQVPDLAEYLSRGPWATVPHVESFLYWSKERFGVKPVISVTQVSILRGSDSEMPEVVVVGKQVFATHYSDASLSVTAVVRDGTRRYLTYLNASDLDVLDGMWGGLVRRILERRLKSEAPTALKTLRLRLESGEPPH